MSIDKAFSYSDRPIRSCSTGAKSAPLKQNGYFPSKNAKVIYIYIYIYIEPIRLAADALLNAPAGPFSKDIDEVEVNERALSIAKRAEG